jgi:hypothetical protein
VERSLFWKLWRQWRRGRIMECDWNERKHTGSCLMSSMEQKCLKWTRMMVRLSK